MAAAKAGNSSRTGCCAWFLTNSSISLTNMQVSEFLLCLSRLLKRFSNQNGHRKLSKQGFLQTLQAALSGGAKGSDKSLFVQIPAGLWYVGVFSDPEPGRFQAKMVLSIRRNLSM